MAKYIIDSSTLEGLGDAIRSVTGVTKKYTPEEMIDEVKDILNATTFILVDKDGNEYPAVYVDSDTVITATPNDIRKGTTAITSEGVITGEKVIPSYLTVEGYIVVHAGSSFSIPIPSFDGHEFTKLQAIICPFSGSIINSVAAERIAINNGVYVVNSTEQIATVVTNAATKTIDLGIINDTSSLYLIRFFTYKEVY